MPLETLSSDYCVSFASSVEVDFAVRENEFGPGYAERDADGINNLRDTWNVEFGQMPYTEMAAVWEFLQNKKGYVSFWWTPPREDTQRKWVCVRLARTMASFNEWTINATFQENFSFLAGSIGASVLDGVQASAHLGTITQERITEGGNQPIDGVEAVCSTSTVHPVSAPTSWHDNMSTFGYRTAVIAGDGYLYAVCGTRWIEKYDPASMQLIDVLDCKGQNGITGVGLQHRWYWALPSASHMRNCYIDYDDDYLYVGPFSGDDQSGMWYRVALSDFRSTTRLITGQSDIDGLGVPVGDYMKGGEGGMFIHGGYMWLLPGIGSTATPYIVRVDLSDFTTSGMSSVDLTPFQVNGDKYNKVRGWAVHDDYITIVFGKPTLFGAADNHAMRFDMTTFSTLGVDLLDISDTFDFQAGLCGRGAVDSDYVYFANSNQSKVYRIARDHLSFDVFDYGSDKAGNSVGGLGCALTDDGHLWVGGSSYCAFIKIDLTSNGGAFSSLTTEFIDVQEYALGDAPFGDRSDDGGNDMIIDGQWAYFFPYHAIGNPHRPIMRVALTQGSFDPWPPVLLVGGDHEISDYDWAGGDNAPSLPTDVTYEFALSSPLDVTKKYVISLSCRMQTGGDANINTLSLGGATATRITDNTNGTSYAGLWLVGDDAGDASLDLVFNATDPVYYYDSQIWEITGMANAVPAFVHTPQSGTGKEVSFTYDLPSKGIVFGCVSIDAQPTDWDYNFTGDDAGTWSMDNRDWWGPETDYGDATNLIWQFTYENADNTPISGAAVTLSWDSPPDTEDLPWVAVMMSMTYAIPADTTYSVIPLQGVQAVGQVFTNFGDEAWLNAKNGDPVPYGGYD